MDHGRSAGPGASRKTVALGKAWVPAKINLVLRVEPRGADGYHPVSTVYQALAWGDRLRFFLAPGGGGVSVRMTGPWCQGVPRGPDNLVVRAVEVLSQEAGEPVEVEVEVEKRIPAGRGLGGGSADAAATLVALDRFLGFGLGRDRLWEIAAGLGSDVPFFLEGGTALGMGRGTELHPLGFPGAWPIVVVWPDQALATREVYDAFDRGPIPSQRPDVAGMMAALEEKTLPAVAAQVANDLEEAACRLCPSLVEVLAQVRAEAGVGTAMTGSGSACFALCPDPERAEQLARTARGLGLTAVVTRLFQGGVQLEYVGI